METKTTRRKLIVGSFAAAVTSVLPQEMVLGDPSPYGESLTKEDMQVMSIESQPFDDIKGFENAQSILDAVLEQTRDHSEAEGYRIVGESSRVKEVWEVIDHEGTQEASNVIVVQLTRVPEDVAGEIEWLIDPVALEDLEFSA